jgi:hypothetical protein
MLVASLSQAGPNRPLPLGPMSGRVGWEVAIRYRASVVTEPCAEKVERPLRVMRNGQGFWPWR